MPELASDGQPIFVDGLSRRQYLAKRRPERKAELIEELHAEVEEEEDEEDEAM